MFRFHLPLPSLFRQPAQLLASVLAATIVAFGLVTIGTTIRILVTTYSPVLFGDQWAVVNTLLQSHEHWSLGQLWAQHNEHRILTARLLGFADLYWFGGRNVSLFVEIILLQLCHLLLFSFLLLRFGRLPRALYWTLMGFTGYCLLSPLQMENFVWAFQVCFILTSFLATACFASALCYAEQLSTDSRRGRRAALIVCLMAAFLAEASAGHGLVVWPILVFLSFALGFRARDRWIIVLVAAVSVAAYLIGYVSPNPPNTTAEALAQPLKLFHFIVTYLGSSWDAQMPNPSPWPSVAESVTALVIVATLVGSWRALRHRNLFSPVQIAFLASLLFGLGSAAMTALGRLQFGGIQGAMAIRYQTPALLFWASLAALIAVSCEWNAPRVLLAAQASLLILMTAAASRWALRAEFAAQREYNQEFAWNDAMHGQYGVPPAPSLFYPPEGLKVLVPFMREHRWGPSGEITSSARLRTITTIPELHGYRVRPQPCVGHWDKARRSGFKTIGTQGWVADGKGSPSSHRIAVASQAGEIIGFVELNAARPDVVAHFPGMTFPPGWDGPVTVPGDGTYHAFLLFEDKHSACTLGDELVARHFPETEPVPTALAAH